MESGLRTLSPQGLDPSPMPSLPDILAHTATCELEQEDALHGPGPGPQETGTRGEPGHGFLNPQDSAAAVLESCQMQNGIRPDPPQDHRVQSETRTRGLGLKLRPSPRSARSLRRPKSCSLRPRSGPGLQSLALPSEPAPSSDLLNPKRDATGSS